jgi:hypothetical protein
VLKSSLVLIALILAVPITAFAMDWAEPAANAARALPAPRLAGPDDDANVQSAPVFTWQKVRRAAKYEFQLSADSRFRSIVNGAETMNTAFTLDDALPDGDYNWRVRAIGASGGAGLWSRSRSLTKRWSRRPTLVSPADDTNVAYPETPLVLRWDPVPHAVKYVVTLAADPGLASPVIGTPSRPIETSGTAFAPNGTLEPGQYWWAVTPENAVGHRGARSAIGSFTWSWPSATSVSVTDLNSDARVYDPQFSWDRVPGAARYEVEVNPSQDFAVGSRVCCADKTIGTSLSPVKLFPNNTYYWRVRAFDADGRSGVWNVGTPFQKTFDPVEPFVPGLALRSNVGPLSAGASTDSPILTWDPVPGASSYEVQVVPYELGGCNWSSGAGWGVPTPVATATTAWTALASGGATPAPPHSAATEPDNLQDGDTFCARVRARTGTATDNSRVVSEWTYLPSSSSPAFTYTAHPGPVSNTKVTAGAGDYVLPASGAHRGATPLFTWQHIAGACGYFVVVAKDAEFTTIVDVARTKIPAYAPRPDTYSDETTSYYWVVIPVVNPGCGGVFSIIGENNPQSFLKESTPPPPLGPPDNADVTNQPTFRWGAAEGAREYRLQVAHDPSFASLIDDVLTASTAYTSSSTYPADALLYWRVRANDENAVGLTWSPTQTFRRRLAVPDTAGNSEGGEGMPFFSWLPVPGAISYDVNVEEPDGDSTNFNLRPSVFTPSKAAGLGVWQWRVRANFPAGSSSSTSGAYSPRRTFTRFMNPPTGAHATRDAPGLVVQWDPSFALAKDYKVEFSESSSFTRRIDSARVDNTAYAPTLSSSGFRDGGPIYWRVAAVDEGNNVGGWASGRVGLLRRMVLTTSGILRRRERSMVEVNVKDAKGRPVRGARVSLRGAGIHARSRRTTRRGIARFRVKPRVRGSVKVRADKRGFRPGSAVVKVH